MVTGFNDAFGVLGVKRRLWHVIRVLLDEIFKEKTSGNER